MDSQGINISGKQGMASNPATTPLSITVSGTVHSMIGTASDEAETILWATATDPPATWDYLFFWADQAVQLQMVATASAATFEVAQYAPFVLSNYKMLGIATNTQLAAQATTTAIESILMGNYDADATCNYRLVLID